MSEYKCPVCNSILVAGAGLASWHFTCQVCGYEKSVLNPAINVKSAHKFIDESARSAGLRALREKNFNTILGKMALFMTKGGSLLEVGCAHGWFLNTAQADYNVMGIEPDRAICESGICNSIPIRHGYFPECLKSGEVFEGIVFNDVFEHMPDVTSTLEYCYRHLTDAGTLILNLPNSRGFFYRSSKIALKFGIRSFFERLWQKDLPSPHLHYFNPSCLVHLLKQNGFKVEYKGNLSSLFYSGLYTRVSYTGNLPLIIRLILCLGIIILLPLLKLFPKDIFYVIAQKEPSTERERG